jgi:hypothetical protein
MLPALIVQQAGIGVETADNMNTYVDSGGALLANLQNFIGIPGSTVYIVGYNVAGDGGQGMWTWNAGITSGNNTTSVFPNGSVLGGWQRISYDVPQPVDVYATPVTGFSITATPVALVPSQTLILNPAGTLAAGTIIFPSGVSDGYKLTISTSQTITALTLSGATISNAVTTLAAGAVVSYIWVAQANSWFRG